MGNKNKAKRFPITFSCKCVSMDESLCELNAEITISEQMISTISIFDVTRTCYDSVKEKDSVVLCIKKDEKYITVITSYMSASSFRYCNEDNGAKETGITLKYVSSKLLEGFDCIKEEMQFSSFVCEITDGIELIGEFPFRHEKEGDERKMQITSIGELKYRKAAFGLSYFVAPYEEKSKKGYTLGCDYKIQYQKNEGFDISFVETIIRHITLFFEILCGETVTINKLYLERDRSTVEYIGINNFLKEELNCLKNGMDSTSYLRHSIFKLSDFGDSLETAVQHYKQIQEENYLAYESYKQVLLDDEVKIITYNKFLKVMQIVDGYQQTQEDEKEKEEFEKRKQEIISKLEDENAADFVSKYTHYNGVTFRKSLSSFTYEAIEHISGVSKTKAKKCGDEIVNNILNDRDAYTHASKTKKPILSFEEMGDVITCYIMFFRVLNLYKFGLSEEIIRKRLRYNRTFVSAYNRLFGQNIMIEKDDMSTGEFDNLMWGYDEKND